MSRIRGLALAGLLAGSLLVAGCATSPADQLSDDVPQAVEKPTPLKLANRATSFMLHARSVRVEFTQGAHDERVEYTLEGDTRRPRTRGEMRIPGLGILQLRIVGDQVWVSGYGDVGAIATGGAPPRDKWAKAAPGLRSDLLHVRLDRMFDEIEADSRRGGFDEEKLGRVREIFYRDAPAFQLSEKGSKVTIVTSADGTWKLLQLGRPHGQLMTFSKWNKVAPVTAPSRGELAR